MLGDTATWSAGFDRTTRLLDIAPAHLVADDIGRLNGPPETQIDVIGLSSRCLSREREENVEARYQTFPMCVFLIFAETCRCESGRAAGWCSRLAWPLILRDIRRGLERTRLMGQGRRKWTPPCQDRTQAGRH